MSLNIPTSIGNHGVRFVPVGLTEAPDFNHVCRLQEADEPEVLAFLDARPVETVVMASFILDNGIEGRFNRGSFFGYRGVTGELEAVALIGHTTILEARSDEGLRALAFAARQSEVPVQLVMSNDRDAREFWRYYAPSGRQPRLSCTELLFEVGYPFAVVSCDHEIRNARRDEIEEVARAHAEIAFMESGIDPMVSDREGFIERTMRRIDQERVFVVYEGDKLVFKADIVAETALTIYLEGIYVAPEFRGRGIGSSCLSKLTLDLLKRVPNICLLSNINFIDAHLSFLRAGFRNTGSSTALFT
jgi:predicted GNAT family acetyltransferase